MEFPLYMEMIKVWGRFICFLVFQYSDIEVLNCILRLAYLRDMYRAGFQNCWNFVGFSSIFTSEILRKEHCKSWKNDSLWTLSGISLESCPNRKWQYFVKPLTNSPPRKVKTDVSRRALGSPHRSLSPYWGPLGMPRGPPRPPKELPRVI